MFDNLLKHFECDHCGGKEIEEEISSVMQTSKVTKVFKEYLSYDEIETQANDDAETLYRCANCGAVLDNVSDPDDLVVYLMKREPGKAEIIKVLQDGPLTSRQISEALPERINNEVIYRHLGEMWDFSIIYFNTDTRPILYGLC